MVQHKTAPAPAPEQPVVHSRLERRVPDDLGKALLVIPGHEMPPARLTDRCARTQPPSHKGDTERITPARVLLTMRGFCHQPSVAVFRRADALSGRAAC